MRRSFVAIVDSCGLISLLPECGGALRFLRRISGRRRAAGVWTVMQHDQASAIHELLIAGEEERALRELAAAAEFRGPISQLATLPGGERTP